MDLQPTPPQYTPRGFIDIEERLRRAERGGSFRFGAWVPYTPAWWTGGTQPAIGDGQMLGFAARSGSMILARGTLLWGSTTTGGTGTWFFGLPAGARPVIGPHYDSNPVWSSQAAGRAAVVTSTVYTGATVAHPGYTNGAVYGFECLVIDIAAPWNAAAPLSSSWPVALTAGNMVLWQTLVRTG